ncbi:hypothetical protein [Longimicrobium sp.]|uniref:hypothetical protein n=1 Tax=Longimicrobium sp. TaxID=2029185 RepID=UPI002E30DAF1|nr:hypothetical protein [Longimicrobium sp.]HEX6038385.1 hypothetical protein [Longimicrobium sp.]
MKKLTLSLDALTVQSLVTSPAADGGRGTVLGLQESADESAACPSQVYSCVGCDTYDDACGGGDPDAPDLNRRIIVYQTPS